MVLAARVTDFHWNLNSFCCTSVSMHVFHFRVVFKKFPFYLALCNRFIFCGREPIMSSVEDSHYLCGIMHYYSDGEFQE